MDLLKTTAPHFCLEVVLHVSRANQKMLTSSNRLLCSLVAAAMLCQGCASAIPKHAGGGMAVRDTVLPASSDFKEITVFDVEFFESHSSDGEHRSYLKFYLSPAGRDGNVHVLPVDGEGDFFLHTSVLCNYSDADVGFDNLVFLRTKFYGAVKSVFDGPNGTTSALIHLSTISSEILLFRDLQGEHTRTYIFSPD